MTFCFGVEFYLDLRLDNFEFFETRKLDNEKRSRQWLIRRITLSVIVKALAGQTAENCSSRLISVELRCSSLELSVSLGKRLLCLICQNVLPVYVISLLCLFSALTGQNLY